MADNVLWEDDGLIGCPLPGVPVEMDLCFGCPRLGGVAEDAGGHRAVDCTCPMWRNPVINALPG